VVDALLQVNRGLEQRAPVASNDGLKLLLLLTIALLTLHLRSNNDFSNNTMSINLAYPLWCATPEPDHRSGSMKRWQRPGVVLLLHEVARRPELVEVNAMQV
jgi:hypothetical protein